jgi:hypothetical protein
MFTAYVLHPKVVDNYRENKMGRVSWRKRPGVCVFALVISMFGKVGKKFVMGNLAGLGQVVHPFVDFDINVPPRNELISSTL